MSSPVRELLLLLVVQVLLESEKIVESFFQKKRIYKKDKGGLGSRREGGECCRFVGEGLLEARRAVTFAGWRTAKTTTQLDLHTHR